MMSKRRVELSPVARLAAAGVLASFAGLGCGNSRSDRNAAGADAGEAGSPTGSGGTTASGGASGDSGATGGGLGGTDPMGGNAGEAGGTSSGAAGSMAAGSGPGGSGGAGQGGSAGSGPAGMTGTLGEPCSRRGALACAGNHQKLTVLCGGDDTWQPNETCGANEFCDTTPGPNVGTCQPVAPGCENGPASPPWCAEDDKNIVTCGPDAVTTPSTVCSQACHDGECRDDVSDCPVWDDYEGRTACSWDCGTLTAEQCPVDSATGCVVAGVGILPAVVRTSWADETCVVQGCATMQIRVSASTSFVRVTSSPPWSIGRCTDAPRHCLVSPPDPSLSFVVSAPPESTPGNIVIEEFESEPSCPQQRDEEP